MKADLGFADLAEDNSHGPRADFHHESIGENTGNSLPILIALHFTTPTMSVLFMTERLRVARAPARFEPIIAGC